MVGDGLYIKKCFTFSSVQKYHDNICVYDEHPIAGGYIQYQAPDSQTRYTTPFNDNILWLNIWFIGTIYSIESI